MLKNDEKFSSVSLGSSKKSMSLCVSFAGRQIATILCLDPLFPASYTHIHTHTHGQSYIKKSYVVDQ